MRADLRRLIAPRSIALIGAGDWTDAVAAGNRAVGYRGALWRVHPTRVSNEHATYFRSVDELPGPPDAAFVAVPKAQVPAVAGALAARGAGGFVCFTAGFSETGGATGARLTGELVEQAGRLPFFGPNCYGFVNFFDGAALLPDQVVGARVERGVALICQSGTIALTLMFNDRSLPIGCLFTVGNQTRLAVEDLIDHLCDDPRVSAFGLYLEGIKDAAAFARAADKARLAGKPIAMIKSGRTAAAARTAHSHTGALAGVDAVFDAFCRQSGIARCDTLSTLCETLKLLHVGGVLPGRRIFVLGASGGDMAMTADVSRDLDLEFPPIPGDAGGVLGGLLTDRVTLANPLDMHTYLWFDPPSLGRVFKAALHAGYDAVGFMLDCPPEGRADSSSFDAVIDEFIGAAGSAPAAASRAVLIASLPETIGVRMRRRCLDGGVVPLQGQREALEALSLVGGMGIAWRAGTSALLQGTAGTACTNAQTLSEAEGKRALASYGVTVPAGCVVATDAAASAARSLGFPVVVKAVGAHLEHKSDVGGVALYIGTAADAQSAAERMAVLSDRVLVERMTTDGVAEILIGVVVDPQFGQVLVIAAGGILTELLADRVTLLPPWTPAAVQAGLARLRAHRLLQGHRGKPAGDVPALVDTIVAVGRYASAHAATLLEIDVNPVIVRPAGCGVIAVDALIRLRADQTQQLC